METRWETYPCSQKYLYQKGLIGEHARVQCLLDGNEGRHFYPYIPKGGVGDLEHCRQMFTNEVSTETDHLYFNVIVCCSYRSEKVYDGMNDLQLVEFFIHGHEEDEFSNGL